MYFLSNIFEIDKNRVNNLVKQTAGKDFLQGFAPKFAELNDDVLFGEEWSREDKLLKTRSITTITALISKGITDSSLANHLKTALNAWAAFRMAKEIYVDDIQEEEAQSLKPGDVVTVPAGVKHWHGAKAHIWFSHLAVECLGENTSKTCDIMFTCFLYTKRTPKRSYFHLKFSFPAPNSK